jgi:hypothetical protein
VGIVNGNPNHPNGEVMYELTLICGQCRTPITDGAGYLGVSLAEVRSYLRDLREWQAAHSGQVVDLHTLLEMREEIAWRAEHYACAETRGDNGDDSYEIGAGRIPTWAALTHWTSHLMSKNWLPATDWAELLEEVANGESERIRVRVRSAA